MTTSPHLVLVDGSSYLFRAFYALPPLTTNSGQPTGAMYGVINMLQKLLDSYKPKYFAVVFDAKGPNFRHEIYPEYKANRNEMPVELASQIKPLHDIIQAMGLPLVVSAGVEADDVIGTLAKQATAAGLTTLISTGDKDLAQLVNETVSLINTMSDELLDIAGVVNKFKVPAELITDYLALMGDTSDNIPGVEKVGPKTAVKWLNAYGSLAEVIANAEQIKGKVGENLRNSIDKVNLAKRLTTIKCDVPLEVTVTELCNQAPNNDLLREYYQQYEFKSWLENLGASKVEKKPIKHEAYKAITTTAELAAWEIKLHATDKFAIDTETTSVDYSQAELVGIALAVGSEAAYIPLAHDTQEDITQLDIKDVIKVLKPVLEDRHILKIMHNAKYDIAVLEKYGLEIIGYSDTMLASYVYNSTATKHDLDSLAKFYLSIDTIKFTDVAGKGANQVTFNKVSIVDATEYAAEDAAITLKLYEYLQPKITITPDLKDVLNNIEIPLITVILEMEKQGVLLDKAILAEKSEQFSQQLKALADRIYAIADCEFNLNSPKQLQEILFTQLKMPVISKTASGQPSTSESVLTELAFDYELPDLILKYRQMSKLKSTYTDKLPTLVSPISGRLHTSYHQSVTATGRLSSSNPNLQNIPIKSEQGREIRTAFVAPAGSILLAADYSQIELRIMAHLSKDEALIAFFTDDLDVHRSTASKIFGTAYDAVTDTQRRQAKAINFGLIYGMSAYGLSQQLHISPREAKSFMEAYFAEFPRVKAYMEKTRELARASGYVETIKGRRLYLPGLQAKNIQQQKAAERAAINAPMQGSNADIIKLAMIELYSKIKQPEFLGTSLLMQVHDELVLEVPIAKVGLVKNEVIAAMTNVVELDVPLKVTVGIGPNWGSVD